MIASNKERSKDYKNLHKLQVTLGHNMKPTCENPNSKLQPTSQQYNRVQKVSSPFNLLRWKLLPVKPRAVKSQSNKWLSVPPVTNLHFLLNKAAAKAFAFFFTCCIYALYSGVATCLKAIASAAMWLLCGPPCKDGKTAKFIFSSKSQWLLLSPWVGSKPCFLDFVSFL